MTLPTTTEGKIGLITSKTGVTSNKSGSRKLPKTNLTVVIFSKKKNEKTNMTMLMEKTDNEVGMEKPSNSRMAMPVAPPAATLLGSKNKLILIAINSKDMIISKIFEIFFSFFLFMILNIALL